MRLALQLLNRYGVLLRESVGGQKTFRVDSARFMDVLKALEESGRIRRGYFVADWALLSLPCRRQWILLRSCAVLRPRRNREFVQFGRR